jgi:hypothetical protein
MYDSQKLLHVIFNKQQNRPPIIPDDEETLSHVAKHYWDKLYLMDEIWPNFKELTVTEPIGKTSYGLFDVCRTVIVGSEKLIADYRNI